jgi:DNA-binding XRE family transcriptional regulator
MTMLDARDLSELLRISRVAAGRTQGETAAAANVTREFIGLWERGDRMAKITGFINAVEANGLEILVRRRRDV